MEPYTPHTLESLPEQARRLSAGTVSNLTGYTDYTRVDAIRQEFSEFCEEVVGHFETWALAWPEFVKVKAEMGQFFLNCTFGGRSRESFLGIRSEHLAKIMLTGKEPESRAVLAFEISRMAIALKDHGPAKTLNNPGARRGGRGQGTWNVYSESDIQY